MKKITLILLAIVFTSCSGKAQQKNSTAHLFEDENLKININYFEEANILDKNWFSFTFYNKSKDTIIIEEFEYRSEYDTTSFNSSNRRKNSLGQGNKYDVFPVFEAKENPSRHDVIITPFEKIIGYRSVSNYASVLLGYDNKTELNIFSKIKMKLKYLINEKEVNLETESSEFNFIWTKANKTIIPQRLVEYCDSIHLRGNYWIIGSLMNDTSITKQISEDTYVRLITQKVEDPFLTRRYIISAFARHYKTNNALNEFYKIQLQKPNPLILQDLDNYWDNSLLEPLVQSLKLNNKNHYQYLRLLDKHYDLWKNDTNLKSQLYKQIKDYAFQVLVSNQALSNKNKSGWQSWINELKMTHSLEAEEYFKTFFKNQLPLFEEENNPLKFYSNAPSFYPTIRACDAALEAYIYSKYGDVAKIYSQKFDELVDNGVLEKTESNTGFYIGNKDFLNKENMQTIRNELIKDYR